MFFAGGSSLNVLNAAGINPHFGFGVDPNPEQSHRLLTNHAFHLPYFYRSRLSHNALKMIQGPKLYIPGTNSLLANWFEEELGMQTSDIDEGHNVVNLCTEIACRLGCNPIIYVGMDLAFTASEDVQTYAKGIDTHPLWMESSRPYQVDSQQKAVIRQDIFHQPINTKWDWIHEANWLGLFAKRHPQLKMINATEGGLGFPPVPNLPLAQVIDKYLTHVEDISNLIHAEIQESAKAAAQPELMEALQKMQQSLARCISICEEIINKKSEELISNFNSEKLKFYDPATILLENNLHEEIAYRHFLEVFEDAYLYLVRAHQMGMNRSPPPFLSAFDQYKHLYAILDQHLNLLNQGYRQFVFFHPPRSPLQFFPSLPRSPNEVYRFQDDDLWMEDPELGIFIHETFHPDPETGRKTSFYPTSQQLKRETYYRNKAELHGPSRFYGQSGELLSEAWFYQGQQHGKNIQWYPSGRIYSILGYRRNYMEGKQEYFYENGSPHVVLHYENGLLEGPVQV